MKGKSWDEHQADILTLENDLAHREVSAMLPDDARRSLAKIGESLNLSAAPLLTFLVLMGACYLASLDTKTLNVIRAVTGGDVNLEGPGYDLPF